MGAIYTPREWRAFQVERLVKTFSTVDSTLHDVPVVCKISHKMQSESPAESIGTKISFNASMVPDIGTTQGIVEFTGLNYHELAHVMFTEFGLVEPNLHNIYNMLEDQRIETLLIAKYESTRNYFVATFAKFCLDSADADKAMLLPLAWGRRYLPSALRDEIAELFPDQAKVPDIKRIIDEYRVCASRPRKKELVKEMYELLYDQKDAIEQLVASGKACNGTADHGGRPNKSEVEDLAETASEKAEDGTDEHGDADYDIDMDEIEGTPADKVNGVANGLAKAVMENPEVQQEVDERREAMNSQGAGDQKGSHQVSHEAAHPNFSLTATKLAQVFKRIEADVDPGFRTHQSSGRINMKRAMTGDYDIDTVFDSWEEGNQLATDIELEILVDRSDSMTALPVVCHAAWALKRAVEMTNSRAQATIRAYHTDTDLIIAGSVKASPTSVPVIYRNGGTDPTMAIQRALENLHSSRRTHKMLIILTDGSWGYGGSHIVSASHEQLIQRANDAGVTTALAYYATGMFMNDGKGNKHKCQHYAEIKDGYDLIPFVGQIVASIIGK